MNARLLIVPTLALLALNMVSAPVAATEARNCALTAGPTVVNCGWASMNMAIHYETCDYALNQNGVWVAYCATTWTVSVSATQWITPGSWALNWPGWCGPESRGWQLNGGDWTVSCYAQKPVYAARCDIGDPSYSITVRFAGASNPAGAATPHPGNLVVSASAQRPYPPGGC